MLKVKHFSKMVKLKFVNFLIFAGNLICLFNEAPASQNISLSGEWLLTNHNMSHVLNGMVPGSMYTDLMRNGTIGDPYYRFNDVDYRWIALDNWTYSRLFDVPSLTFSNQAIVLVCDGLDTVAKITVNGQAVGSSTNMFVQYIFDVQNILTRTGNNITISFESAITYAERKAEAYPYFVPPRCPPDVQHGECHVNFIRKEQCSFSWDWGPSFPTQGIWKDIRIEAYNSAQVRDITVETLGETDDWDVNIGIFFDNGASQSDGDLVLSIPELNFTVQMKVQVSDNSLHIPLQFNKTYGIKEWWPNGYGNQTLYQLKVQFSTKFGDYTLKTVKFGFRTVELVQEKIQNSSGLSFYFKINGMPIFMKGSNWIPADSFQERVTESRLRNLLQSAVDAHMNMLRVWGGGIYEQDTFYDLADEMGILIWQDFMFACALYPVDKDFLDSVTSEVTHQVRRLKHHPSVAVWSANNENEGALATDWYGVRKDFTRNKADYVKLYIDTVMSVAVKEDSSRPFLPSSPTNGMKTKSQGWVSSNPGDTHYGDIHHYDYFGDSWNWQTGPRPRFASEYGFQSWPSFSSLTNVTSSQDLNYFSAFSEHRQHHENGNLEMLSEALRNLKMPSSPDSLQRFKDYIYVTQINQAMSIKTQTEFYRRSQSEIINGEGHTMGALYWQLNDIWQAPTWSSLEYNGNWKMLHYYARNFFAPVLVSPFVDGDSLKVYLVQDRVNSSYTEEQLSQSSDEVEHYLSMKFFSQQKMTKKFNKRCKNARLQKLFGSRDCSKRRNMDIYQHLSKLDDRFEQFNTAKVTKKFQKSNRVPYNKATAEVLYISCYKWDSQKPLYTWTQPIPQITKPAQMIFEGNIPMLLQAAGDCDKQEKCFFTFALGNSSQTLANWLPLGSGIPVNSQFSAWGIRNPDVNIIKISQNQDGSFTVEISSQNIAPFVWLEMDNVRGRFSDNGFLMVTTIFKVMFYPWQKTNLSEIQKELKVKTLTDIYI